MSNPRVLVQALRRLVNVSRAITGPTLPHAWEATEDLHDLDAAWLAAVLDGWRRNVITHENQVDYSVRWNGRDPLPRVRIELARPRPWHHVLVEPGFVRFLEPRMLPPIDLRPAAPGLVRFHGPVCRLCGHVPPKRARSWCPTCWEALDPQTAQGWQAVRRAVYERDGGVCTCGCGQPVVTPGNWRNQRFIYEVDHVVPLCEGGDHELHNLRLLRTACHRRVTGEAATRRALERRDQDRPLLGLLEPIVQRSTS